MITPIDRATSIKQVFSDLDRKFEEDETQRKAKKLNLPYINLYGFPVDTAALTLVNKEEAAGLGLAVFFHEGKNIKVGILENTAPINALIKKLRDQGFFVELFVVSQSSLKHALDGYQNIIQAPREDGQIHIDPRAVTLASLVELSEKLMNKSVSETLNQLLGAGLSINVSDIHIEPAENHAKIRFRIDGVLQDAAMISKELNHQLVSRIKILGKLKLNVVTKPQDGSFSLTFGETHVDIRVSILPSAFGESIVMRLLRQDRGSLSFDDLGINGLAKERLHAEMNKPNGMILTTGPTGSGKTTTLYAMLNKLNETGVKIITIEDPVEYKIEGVTQTPVGEATGLTFAAALKSILRQDPDIVMVGEMRDLETAETAAQAALTGHIVLSTLHTNDAASALPRMIDLGVKPFVLAPAINAIIGQRLVRKLCQACKEIYQVDSQLLSRVEMILRAIPPSAKVPVPKELKFYHSPGCSQCHGLGYQGRTGVYEVFVVNEPIEELIQKQATTTEIRKQAILDGMLTMSQDGILKALEGVTDIEEVFRVTEE